MTKLQIFKNEDFNEVRTLQTNGKLWFVGKDIADNLGYINGSRDVNRHVDSEDRITQVIPQYQNGTLVKTKTILINESGVYSLIFSSKLKKAREFKRWVTNEVLPSIRKNGGYILGQENASDKTIQEALEVARDVIKQKDLLIESMKPKALFADSVATSNTTILIGELAKILKGNGIETGQNRLFEWLRTNGYLIKRHGTDYNMPTQKSMELGLFKIKETVFTYPDGHTSISKTTKVTGKGQQYFINLFLRGRK